MPIFFPHADMQILVFGTISFSAAGGKSKGRERDRDTHMSAISLFLSVAATEIFNYTNDTGEQ